MYLLSVHRVAVNANSMDGLEVSDNDKVTANLAGEPTVQLSRLAENLTRAAAVTDLHLKLLEAGAGTNSVESHAMGLAKERNVKERRSFDNISRASARDEEMVSDILGVKLKYVTRAERAAREVYQQEVQKLRRTVGKRSQVVKIMNKLRRRQNELWEKLMKENEKKVEHLVKKHRSDRIEDRKENDNVSSEEQRILQNIVFSDSLLEEDPEVPVYGEVSLDDDELNILRKPPKFAMFGKVEMFSIRQEIQIANTKLRWHRREHGYGEDEEEKEETEESKIAEKMELQSRETFDPVQKQFDFRKKRATDVKTNQRIYLPEPRPLNEEAELSVRNDIWEDVVKKYLAENCDEDGIIQTGCNLSESEKRGLKKLKKRSDEGELVIGTTDKSGKLCVSSMESYIRQGQKHVGSDRAVDWEEIFQIQRRMSNHARALVKIFSIGESHGIDNVRRVKGAYQQECDTIPVLFLLPKDHKEKEANGDPKTRPVCGARRSANGRVGNLVSEVLRAVVDSEETDECISTEEMLYHLEQCKQEVAGLKNTKITVASQDVEALYPALDIEETARICAERVQNSTLEFNGVDYVWALKYIAMNLTKEEAPRSKLWRLLPVRRSKTGRRPGINSMEEEEKNTKWAFRRLEFSEEEKRQILGEVIYHAVKTVFKNNLYQFQGEVRIQSKGGSIGGELTQIAARIVMDKWMKMFRDKMQENNVPLFLAKKYVDDIDLVLETLRAGTRWNGFSLEWRKEWEDQDILENEDDDVRTMREVRKLSDSLISFIKLKEDVPANHVSGKIPVWTSRSGQRRKLMNMVT